MEMVNSISDEPQYGHELATASDFRPNRVLLVQPEDDFGDASRCVLEAAGFEIDMMHCEPTVGSIISRTPDCLVLDLALPRDIIKLCQDLRANPLAERVPIIVLTAWSSEQDNVDILDAGADSIILKPVSLDELVIRLHNLLRWADTSAMDRALVFGDLVLDRSTFRVYVHDRDIRLGRVEFRLLEQLMLAPEQPHPRAELFRRVWGKSVMDPDNRIVDVYIYRVRRTLRKHGTDGMLRFIKGGGYVLTFNRRDWSPPSSVVDATADGVSRAGAHISGWPAQQSSIKYRTKPARAS